MIFGVLGCACFLHQNTNTSIEAVSLKDEIDKIPGEKEEKGRLCTDKNLNFLKGFCVPYTWGQFVYTSEMNTSYNASSCSNNVEPWSRCCNDVTVWFFLRQLNSLLLFKNQEAVELCCSLLSVCVST